MTTPSLPVPPSRDPDIGIAVASGGSLWEIALIPLIEQHRSGLHLVRRCVDLADLVAVCRAGLVRVAVVSGDLAHLDRDHVADLRNDGVEVLLVDAVADLDVALGLGVSDVVPTSTSPDDLVRAIRGLAQRGCAPDSAGLPGSATGLRNGLATGSPTGLPTGRATGFPTTASSGRSGEPNDAAAGAPGEDADVARGGRLVAVWGPTGAPGRTTIAVNVASLLAARDGSALLVDADPGGGAVATSLGIVDRAPGLAAACRVAARGRLDADALAGHCRSLTPGLRVLTGATRPDRWRELRPSTLAGVLTTARDLASTVVVDLGAGLDGGSPGERVEPGAGPLAVAGTVLALADVVVVVGTADPVGMVRLAHAVEHLTDTMPATPYVLVVNRVRESIAGHRPEHQVREAVEQYAPGVPLHLLADVPALADRAIRRAVPMVEVAPSGEVARAVRSLADVVAPLPLDSLDGPAGRRRRGRRGRRERRALGRGRPTRTTAAPPSGGRRTRHSS